ncbi:MAG: hypothetical protein NTY69_05980 [Methylococcales bacterium]|nr:hypothetical protein [Methylococcales bacterium]
MPVNNSNQPISVYLGSLLEEHKFAITVSSLLGNNIGGSSITTLSLVDASQGVLIGNVTDGWTFIPRY